MRARTLPFCAIITLGTAFSSAVQAQSTGGLIYQKGNAVFDVTPANGGTEAIRVHVLKFDPSRGVETPHCWNLKVDESLALVPGGTSTPLINPELERMSSLIVQTCIYKGAYKEGSQFPIRRDGVLVTKQGCEITKSVDGKIANRPFGSSSTELRLDRSHKEPYADYVSRLTPYWDCDFIVEYRSEGMIGPL